MTFNPWTFLLEAINFVVLAYILHRLLYRPLREAIERRRDAVRKAQGEAEKARDGAAAIKQQLEAKLTELEQKRQDIIRQASQQGDDERKKILDDAEKTAQRRQEEVRRSLASEREEMLHKLAGEVVTSAVNLAERLLHQSADATLNAQLMKHLIETLNGIPSEEREQMRRDWQTENQAWLETATEPDAETLTRLSQAVNKVAARELALTVRNKPALISGAQLRIGGHIWDASIAGQLDEAHPVPREVTGHA